MPVQIIGQVFFCMTYTNNGTIFANFAVVLWGRTGFDSDSSRLVQACRAMW